MPCGKRPLIKKWDKPRNIPVITPSRYEQNEASVKEHWKKVVRDLELSYKDEQFWESQCDTVRELVGPVIFPRIAKIFNLPLEATKYEPQSDDVTIVPSDQFYNMGADSMMQSRPEFSMSDFELSVEEEQEVPEEPSELWSVSSIAESSRNVLKRSASTMKSTTSKSLSKSMVMSMSKTLHKSISSRFPAEKISEGTTEDESEAATDDDIIVNVPQISKLLTHKKQIKNPHFDMLYCNESETDMIKWKSKYKQKEFEVSASDEFSKKAEIMTKKISKEFYDWWVGLGNVEFKSEIKRPEDIESLFQVWFDEHASRGLVLDPRILPCVLQSIANYVGVPRASCPRVLKRQIASDIHAETSPAHVMAFGTGLPQKMKHIPPKNNTEEMWHCVQIPEDLKSMACVWDDITHLTSTKAFHKWLQQRPHLPMPPCLKALDAVGDKKQLFVVPSDYVLKDRSASSSAQELALPVSQFALELKEVLSKILNQ